jgi:rhodanese-related sulfurtransferase
MTRRTPRRLTKVILISDNNNYRRLAEINPDREIVAYCRGEYCVLSFEAVALLRARGFKVRRLYA